MKTKINAEKLTRSIRKTGLTIRKETPTLMIISGAIIGVFAIVDFCKKSVYEAAPIIEDKKRVTESTNATDPEANDHESITDICLPLVRVYARPVALTLVSAGLIGGAYVIQRRRNVALGATLAALDRGFKLYRKRVIDRYGEEVDKELRYGVTKRVEQKKIIDPETGEETIEEHEISVVEKNVSDVSIYARFFDESCAEWMKNPECNLVYLRARQEDANTRLRRDGFLFLNDVYVMLGIPRTRAGQVVGWIYDEKNPKGDNYVDFGIYDVHRPAVRDFVNGYERSILLDFNVDGDILSSVPDDAVDEQKRKFALERHW